MTRSKTEKLREALDKAGSAYQDVSRRLNITSPETWDSSPTLKAASISASPGHFEHGHLGRKTSPPPYADVPATDSHKKILSYQRPLRLRRSINLSIETPKGTSVFRIQPAAKGRPHPTSPGASQQRMIISWAQYFTLEDTPAARFSRRFGQMDKIDDVPRLRRMRYSFRSESYTEGTNELDASHCAPRAHAKFNRS